jgi:hypothetical protein
MTPTPATIAPSIPGTNADEEPAREPAWPVVTVGRAGIRGVVVIAVWAVRRIAVSQVSGVRIAGVRIARCAICRRSDSNSHTNLCVGLRRRHKYDAKHGQQR